MDPTRACMPCSADCSAFPPKVRMEALGTTTHPALWQCARRRVTMVETTLVHRNAIHALCVCPSPRSTPRPHIYHLGSHTTWLPHPQACFAIAHAPHEAARMARPPLGLGPAPLSSGGLGNRQGASSGRRECLVLAVPLLARRPKGVGGATPTPANDGPATTKRLTMPSNPETLSWAMRPPKAMR